MFELIKKVFHFIYDGADDYNKTVRDSEHGRRPISADDV
jgi:hypothetical protein